MTICAMASLSLAACNDDNDSNVTQTETETEVETPEVDVNPNPVRGNTISGKLVSYDGETPIANALVYAMEQSNAINSSAMPSLYSVSSLNAVTNETECGVAPEGSLASTCTNADGSYDLNVKTNAEELLVTFEKGAFSAEQKVTLNLAADSSQAGSTALEDTILEEVPKMLVIEGYYDSIELILAKLGLANTESGDITDAKFDLWSSTDGLFVDADNNGKADIYDYEVVFFNCGQEDLNWLMDDGKRQILKDYVSSGGRIYVSDQAYDIVEQTFPEYIDFYGSDATPVDQPENLGAANTGQAWITIQSNVEPVLKSWLEGVTCTQGSCLNADGTVTIKGFAGGWARMNSVNSDKNIDIYVSGQDSDKTMRPLTVAFDYNEGRVTYTSYHNEEGYEEDCYEDPSAPVLDSSDLVDYECSPNQAGSKDSMNAQQRILQYLVFEL